LAVAAKSWRFFYIRPGKVGGKLLIGWQLRQNLAAISKKGRSDRQRLGGSFNINWDQNAKFGGLLLMSPPFSARFSTACMQSTAQ
jgi:hypothetical protein